MVIFGCNSTPAHVVHVKVAVLTQYFEKYNIVRTYSSYRWGVLLVGGIRG